MQVLEIFSVKLQRETKREICLGDAANCNLLVQGQHCAAGSALVNHSCTSKGQLLCTQKECARTTVVHHQSCGKETASCSLHNSDNGGLLRLNAVLHADVSVGSGIWCMHVEMLVHCKHLKDAVHKSSRAVLDCFLQHV